MLPSVVRSGLCAGAIALEFALGYIAPANAIAFTQITSNSGSDFSADFSASVADAGGGQVRLLFNTAAASTGLIGQVYIDDGNGNIASIAFDAANSVGTVAFSVPADPADLPSGNNASPAFAAEFSAGADAPAPTNGVNAGETLALLATLSGGTSFADILAAVDSGDLRLGIHAQSLGAGEDSESFVNTPPDGGGPPIIGVPAPAAVGIFAIGALALIGRRARRTAG